MYTLVFSKNWLKLQDRVLTTIRRTSYLKVGEKIQVHIKPTNQQFEATVLFKAKQPLRDLSTELLTYDTDTKTREEAFAVIQKFYHNTISEESDFFLLLLQKE